MELIFAVVVVKLVFVIIGLTLPCLPEDEWELLFEEAPPKESVEEDE